MNFIIDNKKKCLIKEKNRYPLLEILIGFMAGFNAISVVQL